MPSQCEKILEMLRAGDVVTPFTIYDRAGSLAGHSRIAELRERGHDIICTVKREGVKKWGEYSLRQA